jgi:hypothetical protein
MKLKTNNFYEVVDEDIEELSKILYSIDFKSDTDIIYKDLSSVIFYLNKLKNTEFTGRASFERVFNPLTEAFTKMLVWNFEYIDDDTSRKINNFLTYTHGIFIKDPMYCLDKRDHGYNKYETEYYRKILKLMDIPKENTFITALLRSIWFNINILRDLYANIDMAYYELERNTVVG